MGTARSHKRTASAHTHGTRPSATGSHAQVARHTDFVDTTPLRIESASLRYPVLKQLAPLAAPITHVPAPPSAEVPLARRRLSLVTLSAVARKHLTTRSAASMRATSTLRLFILASALCAASGGLANAFVAPGLRAFRRTAPRVPRGGINAREARPHATFAPVSLLNRASLVPVLSYAGLGGIGAGAAIIASSVAGTSAGALVLTSVVLPAGFLLVSILLNGGGPHVARMMGGQPADAVLRAEVAEVAARVGIPAPAHVYELPSADMNAFAAGLRRGDTTVAVTSGLRRSLSKAELKAVLAHELGHVLAKDVATNLHTAVAIAGVGGLYTAGRHLYSASSRKRNGNSYQNDGSSHGWMLGLGLMVGGAVLRIGGDLFRLSLSRGAEFRCLGECRANVQQT